MSKITIYSTGTCPICDKTKTLLSKWKIAYEEKRIDQDQALLREMLELTDHARTVPQLALEGKWIGGFNELTEMHMEGELDALMQE